MNPDRPPQPRQLGSAAAICAAALCCSLAATAQDGGPIEIGGREDRSFFGIEQIKAAIEFFARHRIDEVEPADSEKTRETEDLFRETLELSTVGYVGHPNLLTLDLSGSVQLSQEESTGSAFSNSGERTNETFFEHDVSALIFKETNTPFKIYSKRSQTTLDRRFGGSLDNILTEHGATLSLQREGAPNYFHYFHRDEDQTTQTGDTALDLTQDTLEWQGQLRTGDGGQLIWDYRFDAIDEAGEYVREQSFDRHDAELTHTYNFGEETEHYLRSTLHIYRETGFFDLDRIRWDESLRLRHTPKFETRLNTMVGRQSRGSSTQSVLRSTAGFQHRLFDSLVTTGEIGVNHLEVRTGGFRGTEYFGDINVQYDKIVPYGVFVATTSLGLSYQEDSQRGEPIHIINEPHSFGSSDRIVLNRQNIVPNSIVVRDTAGVFLYFEGIDYRVIVFSDRVELRPIIGGAIAPGQFVTIDYIIGPEPASRTTTTGLGFTARYDFNEGVLDGLGVYGRYREQMQDRDSLGLAELPESDIRDLILGAEYDIWRFSFLAEIQMHDSTLSPFDATRLEARYTQQLGRAGALTLTATRNDIDNYEDGIQTDITVFSGRWSQKLNDQLRASVSAVWRDEGGDTQNAEGFEQQLELSWKYRQTSIYASARNVMTDTDTDETVFQRFYVGLRREF